MSLFIPISAPVAPEIHPLYVTPGGYFSDILIGLLLLLALLFPKAIPRQARRLPAWEMALVLVIVLSSFLSIPGALSQALAWHMAVRWLVFALAGILLLKTAPAGLNLEKVFVYALLPHLAIGILQMLNHGPLGLPLELALPAENQRAALLYLGDISLYRPYGLTFHPNVFGGLMAAGFLLSLRLSAGRWHSALKGLILLGVLVSFSRSAWLALAIVGLPVLYWRFKQHKLALPKVHPLLLAAILLAGCALLPFVVNRFLLLVSESENASVSARGQMLQLAVWSIQAHPLAGIGAGNFPLYMSQFETLDPPHYVHNIPMLFASEIGIAAGLAWLGLWLLPMFRFLRRGDADLGHYPLVAAWTALGIIGLWDNYPATLESTRLLLLLLLVSIPREPASKD